MTNDSVAPTGLMVGLLAAPEKAARPLPTGNPRFTWIPPFAVQSAYRIIVRSITDSGTVWDSGRVQLAKSVAVLYGTPVPLTPPLPPGSWTWEVQAWSADGIESGWSGRQAFRTGTPDTPETGVHGDPNLRTTVARYQLEQVDVAPVRVVNRGPDAAFVDFGRAAFAGLTLTLTAANDGEKVTVHLSEAADGDTVRRMPGGSVRCHRAEVILHAGTHSYDIPLGPKDGRMMPPDIGPVMPFRYVEIEGLHAPLASGDIVQRAARYPFNADAAQFSSSNPDLDRVWEISRYTIEATTFCGVYVDGDRERLPYEADAYINMLGHYAADREFTLARYTQELLIQQPTWPTEWFHFSVMCAWEDYLHTGDNGSLSVFYDDLCAKTLFALIRPDGLISTVEPPVPASVAASVHHLPHVRKIEDIVDWPPFERDGYEMRPVNTVVNAFFCHALDRMARIAAALGKTADANLWRERAKKSTAALNALLFDQVAGLYRDGSGSERHSLHANMFPLAFGLAPEAHAAKIADFLIAKGMACSVYGAQFLLDALYNAGRGEAALALITARGDRGWLHMQEALGSTMTLEAWDAKFKPNLDWNHAWGAAPANIVPRRLMGVEPLEAGYRRALVRPQPGGLAHAEATIPTVRGPIHVSFDGGKPGVFRLEVTLPPNTSADVYVPIPAGGNERAARLFVDGREVAAPTFSRLGSALFIAARAISGSGTYRYECHV